MRSPLKDHILSGLLSFAMSASKIFVEMLFCVFRKAEILS